MNLENQLLRLINKWADDTGLTLSQDDTWDLANRIAMIAKAKTQSQKRQS